MKERKAVWVGKAQKVKRNRRPADCHADCRQQYGRRQPQPRRERLAARDNNQKAGNDEQNTGRIDHGLTGASTNMALEFDLPAKLDHPVGRDVKELRRRQRIAMHRLEQPPSDRRQARSPAGHNGHTTYEKRGVHHIELSW